MKRGMWFLAVLLSTVTSAAWAGMPKSSEYFDLQLAPGRSYGNVFSISRSVQADGSDLIGILVTDLSKNTILDECEASNIVWNLRIG